MRNRRTAAAALVAAALLAAGCVSLKAINASPEVKYYAALADYNSAKAIAAAYAEVPTTPVEHIDQILRVVRAVDVKVKAFEDLRTAGLASADRYDAIVAVLEAGARQLERYATPAPAPEEEPR